MEALHLYGVIQATGARTFKPINLGGAPVFPVCHRDLAAFVSRSPSPSYRALKKEELVRYLFLHQAVIEKIMEAHTVVPVKFGTTAPDETEVQKILERGYPQLTAVLEAMEDKIELDVIALWRELNSVLQEIGEEEEIRKQKEAIAAAPAEETHEERIRIGQRVKARMDQRREALAAEIVEALKPLAWDLCPHALLDDRMILNMAFLVDRSEEAEIGHTLSRLNGRYGDGIDFRCVGPLPPYSFSTVEVRRFEFGEIDRARRLLGLRESATSSDVKEAYRKLAHQCHPDKVGQESSRRFEELTDAYGLLAEYCQGGGRSCKESDVREAITVGLLHGPAEATGA